MRTAVYTCDSCLKEAPSDASWWMVTMQDGDIPQLTIVPWGKKSADDSGKIHACSEPCALAIAAVFLSSAVRKTMVARRYEFHSLFSSLFGGPRILPADESPEDDEA